MSGDAKGMVSQKVWLAVVLCSLLGNQAPSTDQIGPEFVGESGRLEIRGTGKWEEFGMLCARLLFEEKI